MYTDTPRDEARNLTVRDYCQAFGKPPPGSFEVDVRHVEQVLRAAIDAGQPLPDGYDWHTNRPAGTVV